MVYSTVWLVLCWVVIIIITFLGNHFQFNQLWWKRVKNPNHRLQRACDDVILSKKTCYYGKKKKERRRSQLEKAGPKDLDAGQVTPISTCGWNARKTKTKKKTRPAGDGASPEGCHGVCAPFCFLTSYSCIWFMSLEREPHAIYK